MDQEKLARLPKWAQNQIENDQRTIEQLKAHIAELSSDHPDSNVKVNDYIYGDQGLPPDSHIDFYLGERREKYRDMITVEHSRKDERKVLRIAASESLVIRPVAANSVMIWSQRF